MLRNAKVFGIITNTKSEKTISSLLSFAVAELLRRIQAQNQENAEFGSTQDHPHFRIWSGSLNSQYFRV